MLCGRNLVNNFVRKPDQRKNDLDKFFLEFTAKKENLQYRLWPFTELHLRA